MDEINAADLVSNLHPTLNRDELCKALVAQYLSHDGYVETARAFAREVRAEATVLRGPHESKLEGYLSMEEDHDAMNRQRKRDPDIPRGYTNTSQKSALPSSTATLTKPSNSPTPFTRTSCKNIPEFISSSAVASS